MERFYQTVFGQHVDVRIYSSEVEIGLIDYLGLAGTWQTDVQNLGNDHIFASLHPLFPFETFDFLVAL